MTGDRRAVAARRRPTVAWRDHSGSTATYVVLAVISLALLAVTSHRLAAPHLRQRALPRPVHV
jgi:hypothetical protein